MVTVAAALIRDGSRFLIGRRPAGKARGGLWEFVGGKVEPGETPAEALVRECREELGAAVTMGREYGEWIHAYPDLTVRLILFEAELHGEPKPLEHEALRWITPAEIPGYDFCPADVGILTKLAADVDSPGGESQALSPAGETPPDPC